MESRERADNLEFWSGRDRFADAGEDPDRRSRPLPAAARRPAALRLPELRLPGLGGRVARRHRGRGRARPLAAGALLASLAAAWLAAGHGSQSAIAGDAPVGTAVGIPAPSAPVTSLPATTLPATRGCAGLSAEQPAVRCVLDGVAVEVRRFAPATVGAEYARAAGTPAGARSGPASCARGVAEERSWSLASSPSVAIGRYRCTVDHGRAVMWWTRDARLFHAVASDGDLARLFAWWRARPSE